MGVVVRSSSFKGNHASEDGGAIFRSNELPAPVGLQVENSTFYNNRADDSGAAIKIGYYPGKDIYNTLRSWIKNSTFVDNHQGTSIYDCPTIIAHRLSPTHIYNSVFAETRPGHQTCFPGGAQGGKKAL